MKKIASIFNTIFVFYFTLLTNVFASTYVYNDVAIQIFDNRDKIIISKAKLKNTSIQKSDFKIPEIGDLIWTITVKDLQVPETACFDIDATLCSTYDENFSTKCYSNCIIPGIEFITYDEKNHLLYLDAGSDIGGTGGDARFLFVADIQHKKITYLNTFMSPYNAYLSSQGSYLAITRKNNKIEICNTRTGEKTEIIENNDNLKNNQFHVLDKIKWMSDYEIRYNDIIYNNKHQKIDHDEKEKIFDMQKKKIVYTKRLN